VSDPVERPAKARLRRLSEEEIALWIEVAKTVAKRRGATLPALAAPPAPAPKGAPKSAPLGGKPPAPAPARRPAAPPAPQPLPPLERRLKRDLARGRATIDSVLDLHGMTQAEAHSALRGFLMQAQAQGFRLLIVITGKGGRGRADDSMFGEQGVLRRLVPHWLRDPDLRAIVLGFEEAGPAHGGAGALYVRLRRREGR
jgi:DNA-nicking Smr family endonuclease